MHFIVVAYVEESILDPLQCGFVKLSSFLRVVHIKLEIDRSGHVMLALFKLIDFVGSDSDICNRLLAAKCLQFSLLMLFAKGFSNLSQVTLLRPFVFECRTPGLNCIVDGGMG
nr:hypothetical protein [Tanacetum cinerariifolium]